ncbi:MAG: TonB-dependent receptor [Campylobacterales bacterium]|nr:TonB-dependent receptor [Campylobacterales bacterium]
MKKVVLGLSIAACGAIAFDSFELGKIEVTTQKNSSSLTNESISIADTVENTDKKKITDVLADVSGINIQNSGARNEQMIMLRGFDVKHVPLYIDGIPVAVPYDGYVDFSRFLISDLSEIEVSKGFASPLLGANTFAGAINMVTKKPQKELEAELNYGVFGKNGWSSDLNLGTNQKLYYVQFALSRVKRDSYELSDAYNPQAYVRNSSQSYVVQDSGERIKSDFEDTKLNLKFALTPNSTDEYALNYIKQWADKGVSPYASSTPISGKFSNDPYSQSPIRFWNWAYWDKESYYFISKTAFGNGHYIKTRIFYDIFKNSLEQFDSRKYTTYYSPRSYYDDNTKGASVEAFFKLSDKNSLGLAAHYKLDTHKEHSDGAATFEMQDEIFSYGAEYKHKIFDNTNIMIGASYDNEQVKQADDTNYNGTTVPNKEMSHGSAESLNPMVTIETKLADKTTLFGGVGQKSRIPSVKDRYSYKFQTYIANPNLEAETTINYEIGLKHMFGSQVLKTNVFYMNIDDYIQEVKNVSGSKSQLQNVGTVISKGVEIDYSALPFDSLSINANLTLQSMKNENPAIKVTDVPNAMANISLKYMPTKKFSWTNSVRGESGRFSQSDGSTRTDSYVIVNSGVGFNVNKHASVEAGVDNLFDKNYALTYGYPEEGRKLWANLKLKY